MAMPLRRMPRVSGASGLISEAFQTPNVGQEAFAQHIYAKCFAQAGSTQNRSMQFYARKRILKPEIQNRTNTSKFAKDPEKTP